jgi:hypothetical protein
VVAIGRNLVFAGSHHKYAVLAHQTPNATVWPDLFQLFGHSRPTIAVQAKAMLLLYMGQQNHILTVMAVFFAKFCYLALKISLYQRLFRVIPILLYLLAQCRKPDTKIGSYLFSSQPTRQRNTDCLMSKFCRAFRSPSRSPFAHNMQLKERHNSATGPRTSSSKPPEPAAI